MNHWRETEEDFNIRGKILRETDMAILFKAHNWDDSDAEWLPKSQVAVVQGLDGEVVVTMPLWLAEKKEMI